MDDLEQEVTNADTAYEPSDWPLKPIGWVALGVIGLLALVVVSLYVGFHIAVADQSRSLEVVPPAPVLQTNPRGDLAAFRARENETLHSYGWVDRRRGILHIPIEQAMKDVAAKGIDGFPKGAPP